MRDFSDEEKNENGQEHDGSAIGGATLTVGGAGRGRGAHRSALGRSVAFELIAALAGLDQGTDQTVAEDSQRHTGCDLDDDTVNPEVELDQGLVVLGQLAVVDEVDLHCFVGTRVQLVLDHDVLVADGRRQVGGYAEYGRAHVGHHDGYHGPVQSAPGAAT